MIVLADRLLRELFILITFVLFSINQMHVQFVQSVALHKNIDWMRIISYELISL